MVSWLSDMSQNLVADLLLLPILYFAGKRFLDSRTAQGLMVNLDREDREVPAGDDVGYTYRARVRLENLSTEPVYNPTVDMNLVYPKDFPFDVPSFHRFETEDGSWVARLEPGQVAYSPWVEPFRLSGATVRAESVRGRRFRRKAQFPTQ